MNDEAMKHLGDASAVTALIGYFVGALPVVASLFTVIWMGIRIYETDTVQRLLGNKRHDTSVD